MGRRGERKGEGEKGGGREMSRARKIFDFEYYMRGGGLKDMMVWSLPRVGEG